MIRKVLLCTVVVASWMALGTISAIVNTEIKRNIDLIHSVVRCEVLWTVVGHEDQSEYDMLLREDLAEDRKKNAWLSVTNEFSPGQPNLPIERKPERDRNGYAVYAVRLGDEERNMKELQLKSLFVIADILEPLPSAIRQTDSHKVQFWDFSLVPTPYETLEQQTSVFLPKDSKIESFTAQEPARKEKSRQISHFGKTVLKCGPYKTTNPPYNLGERFAIHYVTPAIFAKATNVVREIEVSHWGNIAVEESYEVVNNGAKLIGEWTRLQHIKNERDGTPDSTFTKLHAMLPAGARDIYCRDQIGNVTSTAYWPIKDGVSLDVSPRYPVNGGWSTSWYMGYNLRSEYVLKSKVTTAGGTKRTYSFTLPFGLPFDELWAETMTVKIILPELVTNVKATVPFEVEESRSKRFTYLDSFIGGGRTVVNLRIHNVVKEHNVPFTVSYDYEPMFVYWKVLLICLPFMGLFLMHMVLSLCRGGKVAKIKAQ